MAKPRMNRAKFVRSFDESVAVADILERAKAEGIPLTATDIHSARYYERKRQKKGGRAKSREVRKARTEATHSQEASKSAAKPEQQGSVVLQLVSDVRANSLKLRPDELRALQKLIVRVGVDRMRALIDLVERQLDIVVTEGIEG